MQLFPIPESLLRQFVRGEPTLSGWLPEVATPEEIQERVRVVLGELKGISGPWIDASEREKPFTSYGQASFYHQESWLVVYVSRLYPVYTYGVSSSRDWLHAEDLYKLPTEQWATISAIIEEICERHGFKKLPKDEALSPLPFATPSEDYMPCGESTGCSVFDSLFFWYA